ncbi:hypothetical protein WH52_07060 [Tenacibaculum holothuriorum]|uniref:Nucleotidyltransferase n=1 Tax=Tenacibaculum holothuriorum TaxID=1635173 RepID=A0A1Y2PDD9_9FLAO|nr:nucleotidyltransferase family protein [Tenacibaculum holothuriorum]OSY88504.1 hypothetical protein WH52_07060 [Tenacibaculum holothuriorum]
MNYKDTLFFIGKCLTITHEEHNCVLVEKELKKGNIDWDSVVKVSTSHYVFPALYCNLKHADFLHYLPNDLVEYMKHITDLNRERNQQIIEQAKEINELLLSHNITPIFLKGTGNLLCGLYKDIAERMVGDIDFLADKNEAQICYDVIKTSGYTKKISDLFDDHRHLPRITHPNKIAAIEIHKEILREEKSIFFNYQSVENSLIKVNNYTLLSYKDQIKLTVYSKLINDYQFIKKGINLRAAYDFYLQGNRLEKKEIFTDKELSKELNAGISLYSTILEKPKKIEFTTTKLSEKFIHEAIKNLNINYKTQLFKKLTNSYIFFYQRIKILLRAFYKKDYLLFITSRITNINWYKRKLGI